MPKNHLFSQPKSTAAFAAEFEPALHPASRCSGLTPLRLRTFLVQGAVQGAPVAWWPVRSLRLRLESHVTPLRRFQRAARARGAKVRRPGYVLDPVFTGPKRAIQHLVPGKRS